MNSRKYLAIGVLLFLPAIASTEELAKPAAANPAADTPAASAVSFNLKSPSVQNIVRATAVAQTGDEHRLEEVIARNEKLGNIRFRAPRRLHHMDCDSFDCVAYTADNDPLYSFSRDQMRDQSIGVGRDSFDDWLSCQSANDLMTTFERFDKCRGVNVGPPPLRIHGVELLLPKIRL